MSDEGEGQVILSFRNTVEDKTAFNARAKASMREFLRSKTWVEKVESIERMNVASKLAKEAMAKQRASLISSQFKKTA